MTDRPGVRSQFEQNDETQAESLMLTGDLNVAVVEWIVQYKVKDPYKYLFKVRNLDAPARRGEPTTFRDMNEAVMREVVGDHSVNEVLTVGREQIQVDAKNLLQHLCDRYETGIEVLQVVLQDVNPPDPVKPAFNEVNQAIQEKERLINEAWADYNQTVPERTRRGRAGRARRRGLRARAREQRPRRRRALRQHLRRVPQGARRDAQAPLPRDAGRGAAEDGPEAHHRLHA